MDCVAPLKISFMNQNALNHQVSISVTLLQISVALPTAFQVDANFSFKEKLFHPQLCAAGTSTFAIYCHLTRRGWKQRKYWKVAKIYIECTRKYAFVLFLANVSSVFTAPPGCPTEWFTNSLWLQPQPRPRRGYAFVLPEQREPARRRAVAPDSPAGLATRNYLQNAFKRSRMYTTMCFIYICITLFLEVLYWQEEDPFLNTYLATLSSA